MTEDNGSTTNTASFGFNFSVASPVPVLPYEDGSR
jgi:hypothetical protein